ncbi:hypothetical protein VRRI112168_02765 [Vreelandella rituensis]|uniref:Uncharacterized protein n=1 Tax=Vreelandella rituensis TaxID=2282306 RepID=A0A368U9N8_9GAMM|nr:hypothetical protein [Halomonas rituensis]RCV93665.1 hypothetical protein DU506_00480 [Halomonas rituensis]
MTIDIEALRTRIANAGNNPAPTLSMEAQEVTALLDELEALLFTVKGGSEADSLDYATARQRVKARWQREVLEGLLEEHDRKGILRWPRRLEIEIGRLHTRAEDSQESDQIGRG